MKSTIKVPNYACLLNKRIGLKGIGSLHQKLPEHLVTGRKTGVGPKMLAKLRFYKEKRDYSRVCVTGRLIHRLEPLDNEEDSNNNPTNHVCMAFSVFHLPSL